MSHGSRTNARWSGDPTRKLRHNRGCRPMEASEVRRVDGELDRRYAVIRCITCGVEKRPNAFSGSPVCRLCRNRAALAATPEEPT